MNLFGGIQRRTVPLAVALLMLAMQIAVVLHYPSHLLETQAQQDECPIEFVAKLTAGAVPAPAFTLQPVLNVIDSELHFYDARAFIAPALIKPFHSQGPPSFLF